MLSGPNNLLVYINDLRTTCSIYKYVDDSTIFEICNPTSVSVLQQSAAIIAINFGLLTMVCDLIQ